MTTTPPRINQPPPIGLMVLRVFVERGSSQPLRARIRETSDVSQGFERSFVLTDVEAIVRSVRAWLDGLLEQEAASQLPPAGEPPVNGHV